MSGFRIVLVEPEIPSNTGNIGRTVVATAASLDLVGPLGFKISSSQLKRAGLDYWPRLKWKYYTNWATWKNQCPKENRLWFFSTKGRHSLYDCKFLSGDVLIFGKETSGLKKDILKEHHERTVAIPMAGPVRSLNLANAVAVALYEALRQNKKPC